MCLEWSLHGYAYSFAVAHRCSHNVISICIVRVGGLVSNMLACCYVHVRVNVFLHRSNICLQLMLPNASLFALCCWSVFVSSVCCNPARDTHNKNMLAHSLAVYFQVLDNGAMVLPSAACFQAQLHFKVVWLVLRNVWTPPFISGGTCVVFARCVQGASSLPH